MYFSKASSLSSPSPASLLPRTLTSPAARLSSLPESSTSLLATSTSRSATSSSARKRPRSRDPRSKRMICVKGQGDLCGSCPANAAQGAKCYCN
ncbi:unnamed protein product [Clonostachys chloroleuca]|uniref:Uncharacterized protein n=1 Tax=Clonostachys chloroleuca TaxID=1926264 RepID=A0AA35LPI2_9HYPO|nr:unnamed protein product [Clonostachys chloroleuca]